MINDQVEKINIPFLAGAEVKNKLYFSSYYINGLFYYDFITGKSEYVCSFEGEANAICLYRKAFLCGNEIWFMPWEAKRVALFNVDTQEMTYFDVGKTKSSSWDDGFYDGFKRNYKLYFIPYKVGVPIYVVDLKEKMVKKYSETHNLPKVSIIGATIFGSKFLIGLKNGQIMYGLNNKWETIIEPEISGTSLMYNSMVDDGENVWLIPYNEKRIFAVDKLKMKKKYEIVLDEMGKFTHACVDKNHILLLPSEYSRSALVINRLDNNLIYRKISIANNDDGWLEMTEIDSKNKHLVASSEGNVYKFDAKWNLVNIFSISITRNEYNRHIGKSVSKEMFLQSQCIIENTYFSLDLFLNVIIEQENI